MKLLAFFLFPIFLLSAARADTPRQLYVAGRYGEAENAALAQGNAEGYALAARSVLAAEMMRPEPCMPCLEHAESLAQRAIDADPRLVEGQIEFVVALGYRARLMGVVEAHLKGLAKIARNHIDAALADDPGNAWAWAALGGWNIEIAHGWKTFRRHSRRPRTISSCAINSHFRSPPTIAMPIAAGSSTL